MGLMEPHSKAECLKMLESKNNALASLKSELARWQAANHLPKDTQRSLIVDCKSRIERKKAEIANLKAKMRTLK